MIEIIKYKEEKYFLNDKKRILQGKKQIKYDDIFVCGNCCEFLHRSKVKQKRVCPYCNNIVSTFESAQNL